MGAILGTNARHADDTCRANAGLNLESLNTCAIRCGYVTTVRGLRPGYGFPLPYPKGRGLRAQSWFTLYPDARMAILNPATCLASVHGFKPSLHCSGTTNIVKVYVLILSSLFHCYNGDLIPRRFFGRMACAHRWCFSRLVSLTV